LIDSLIGQTLNSVDYQVLEFVLREMYGQRRKKLSNSLFHVTKNKDYVDQLLDGCGLDPNLRPENVSIEKWCSLANALKPLLPSISAVPDSRFTPDPSPL